MKKKSVGPELDFNPNKWPPTEEFPLNEQKGAKVRQTLRPDIFATTDDFLIITGYTSLSEIVETFGGAEYNGKAHIRIVFGVEPQSSKRTNWKRILLRKEVEDYWWRKGISPFKCGMVLSLLEHINAKRVEFRILEELHAKIYASKEVAIMGSSNFSFNGLTQLHETNIRVLAAGSGSHPHQHAALKKIAENFYEGSILFDDKIVGLLERLMQVVDWEEALARAIAAVLEGHFLDSYPTLHNRLNELKLWPSQMQGIYQGLNILQNQGSILIADPTGSGKTKMICAIQLALVHWLWEIGQQDRSSSLSITPPAVIMAWDEAQNASGKILRRPVSHGILSRKDTSNYKQTIGLLKQTNILVIDEAHNYLSSTSDRSQAMAVHEAAFSLLATATPINKKAEDLLRLIELLDADNLSDEQLDKFKQLYEHRVKAEEVDTEGNLQALRSYIWQFTLRRTKKDINKLIAKDRDSYRNDLGDRCQYPQVKNEEYPLNEKEADIEAARKILETASRLKGLIFLKTLKSPSWKTLDTAEKQETYIKGCLRAASALAQYRIQAMLRSSRAALYEHILGTTKANNFYSLETPKNTETGFVVDTLQKRSAPDEGKPCDTPFKENVLPEWLSDWKCFQVACKEEIAIYREIIVHLKGISDSREQAKAKHLADCLKKHDLVVAFDHTIITLHHLSGLLDQKGVDHRIATGNKKENWKKCLRNLGSIRRRKTLLRSAPMRCRKASICSGPAS